jgi:transcriptional regulator with XRE-family HTH domain
MKKKNPSAIALGEHLKKLRENILEYRNRSNLARELNITPQKISNYESGSNFPSIETLIGLYKKFDVSFEILLKPLLDLSESELEKAEYNDLCKKAKNIQKHNEEWESLKVMIESLMLRVAQKSGIVDEEKRIQRGDG